MSKERSDHENGAARARIEPKTIGMTPDGRRVVVRFDPNTPITQTEVEIFDALIGSLDDLVGREP